MADIILSTVNCSPPNSIPPSLDGIITSIANTDLGNANTSYTYFDLVKSGFNSFSIQLIIEATTITFEATNDALSVSNASANWSDITTVLTSGVATITATGTISILMAFPWSRIRVKRLTTNATNALKIILTRTRL